MIFVQPARLRYKAITSFMQILVKIISIVFFSTLGLNANCVLGQSATYNSDVACIIYTHCTTCHHDGGIAPFSLMNYAEVSSAAFGILQSVNAGTMPPWPPNSEYNRLAYERLLTQQEVAIITDWVNNGAVEGVGVPPLAPVYLGDEEIANPDLVITMPPYTINSLGNDVFRCFVISTALEEDIYITELELVPGNREAVHHVMIYQDESSLPQQLDDAESGPGYTSFGTTNSETSIPIAGWNPGQGKKVFPEGMGVKVPAGSSIIMQIHYPVTSNGQMDQSKVNLKYTTDPLREISISSFIHHFNLDQGALSIPANEIRTFTGAYTLPNNVDITLLDVNIHMHLLGKSAKAWAVMPNNQTIPFIEVEDWDFHWQGFYDFRQPIRIPGGTTFYGEATYDNTTDNTDNPNNPPQLVNVGNASDEEMMLIFFSYLTYEPGDENIVVDTTTTHDEHLCATVGLAEHLVHYDLTIYPNPAENELVIESEVELTTIHIYDAVGRTALLIENGKKAAIDIAQLPIGLYILDAKAVDDKHYRKVFVKK